MTYNQYWAGEYDNRFGGVTQEEYSQVRIHNQTLKKGVQILYKKLQKHHVAREKTHSPNLQAQNEVLKQALSQKEHKIMELQAQVQQMSRMMSQILRQGQGEGSWGTG